MVLFSTQVKVASQAEVWRLIFVQYVARSLCCVVMRMRTMGLRKLINLHVVICILTDFIIKSYDAVWCNTPISSKLQHAPPPRATAWVLNCLILACSNFHPLGQKLTSNAPPCSFLKGKISDRDFLQIDQSLKPRSCRPFLLSLSLAKHIHLNI